MKKYLLHLVALGALLVTSILPAAAANSWPASETGTNISVVSLPPLTPAFEPSGIEWHSGREQFVIVGDEGQVVTMNLDGSSANAWDLGSGFDLEGVAVADAQSSKVYLLDENTSSAWEFDLATGLLTGKSWSFADKLSEIDGSGAEALAYANGSFYVGWQYDGDVYVYSADLTASGSQRFTQEIHMTSGYTDIAGLTYNSDTGRLYALYDGLNLLEERSLEGTLLASYNVPGSNQEGIAFVNDCASSTATVTIAEDSGAVIRYSGYPVACTTPISVPELEPTPMPVPTVSTVVGAKNGDIFVTYSDSTSTTYDVFPITIRVLTSVRMNLYGTSYTLVTLGRYAALVDPMTGDIYAQTTFAKGNFHPLKWARGVLKI